MLSQPTSISYFFFFCNFCLIKSCAKIKTKPMLSTHSCQNLKTRPGSAKNSGSNYVQCLLPPVFSRRPTKSMSVVHEPVEWSPRPVFYVLPIHNPPTPAVLPWPPHIPVVTLIQPPSTLFALLSLFKRDSVKTTPGIVPGTLLV
jgi:hypothetical protein